MSVLESKEFFERLQSRIGEDTSDEAITFIEDVTDTYNDILAKVNTQQEDWKKKYEENDNSWKEKYKERFFTTPIIKKEQEENVDNDGERRNYASLFKEREG